MIVARVNINGNDYPVDLRVGVFASCLTLADGEDCPRSLPSIERKDYWLSGQTEGVLNVIRKYKLPVPDRVMAEIVARCL